MFPPTKRPAKPGIELDVGQDDGQDDDHSKLKDEILAELVEKLQEGLDGKLRSKKPASVELEIDADPGKLPEGLGDDEEDEDDY